MPAALASLLLCLIPQDSAPISSRAVDYVSIRNRQPLFGIVLEHAPKKPLVVAVQRQWLRETQPEAYKEYREQESKRARHQRTVLIERLKVWIEERKDDEFFAEYLTKQLTKLRSEAQADKPQKEPTSQFMIVEIEAKYVRRVRPSAGARRAPLWLAFRERLKNIETKSGEDLLKELREKGLAIPKEPIDLSDRIPSKGDDKFQWAGRQAIIEQLYRENPLKMAGTPTQVFPEAKVGEQADVQGMVAKMLGQRVDDLLKEFGEPGGSSMNRGERTWQLQAVNEAKERKKRAAFVRIVHPDKDLKEAVVEGFLIGRMPDNTWRIVWKTKHSVKPESRPELEKELREDKQIKAILDAMQGLGNEEAVLKAIRFGAATKQANRFVDDAYVKWRDKYFDDLRQPGLLLPKQ